MYIRLFLTVRISFLTLLVITSNKKCRRPRCTACLYGMLSRIILLHQYRNRGCFPKASAKVELFSELANFLEEIFKKKREKINYAVFKCAIL